VARALSTERRDRSQLGGESIALPHDVPPLTFQTIDSEGNVHGLPEPAEPTPVVEPRGARGDVTYITEEQFQEAVADLQDGAGTGAFGELPTVSMSSLSGDATPEAPRARPPAAPAAPAPVAAIAVERAEDPARIYQDGMEALRAKQYGSALERFEIILTRHGEHGLADNALYWKGEVYYDQQQFGDALPVFQSVIEQYPLGNKIPDAMVKVALCFNALGRAQEAREILQQVLEIYPRSDAARVARTRLPTM
jgi:tol-pal system protein YbgF